MAGRNKPTDPRALSRVNYLNSKEGKQGKTKTDKLYILRRLGGYLVKFRGWLLLAAFLMLASNLLALVGPYLLGEAINAIGEVAGGVDMPRVLFYVVLLLIFYLLSAALAFLLTVVTVHVSKKIIRRMRSDVFNRLSTLPVGYFDARQTGDILSVISYDVDTVNVSLSHDFLQICTGTVTIVGSCIMMLAICPPLVTVFAVTIPLSFILTRYITSHTRPLFRRRSAELGKLNGFTEEMLGGQKTVRAYHREQAVQDLYGEYNRNAVDAYTKAEQYGTITGPCVNFVNNLSLALVSVFGALLYMQPGGGMLIGDISSFVLYSRKFSGPINEIANMYGELQSAFAAAERVFRLLDELPEPPDAPDAVPLTACKGDVRFEHVSFGYLPQKEVLHDFDFHAKSGSLTAIVGPTGAGKTTIINLLMRFYDNEKGRILIDGRDIREYTRESLRAAYTMVLQETWLFSGTVYENLAYGREDAKREEIEAAAKAANIHSFIMSLPQGYDTPLSGDGVNVSKGQKQLLTIARAMLIRSPMLILDEATSNVDTRTELRIQDAMYRLMEGKTCFVIAHRLSTIRRADCILVVRDGNVVEKGTHESLMAQNGFYAELYRSQFEN